MKWNNSKIIVLSLFLISYVSEFWLLFFRGYLLSNPHSTICLVLTSFMIQNMLFFAFIMMAIFEHWND